MVRTARAEAMRPEVRRLVEATETLFTPTGPVVPADLKETFVLHATDHLLTVLGTSLDRRIRSEAPGVALEVLPVVSDSPEALRRGETDAAIGVFPRASDELRVRTLFRDRFTCAVRRDHPAVSARLGLRRYAAMEHVRIAPRGRPGGIVDKMLAERGFERRVVRSVPYFLSALLLVAETDYVVTASRRMIEPLADRLGLRCVKPPFPFPIYGIDLLWHPRRDADPAHRWLRESIAAAALDATAGSTIRDTTGEASGGWTTGLGLAKSRRTGR